MLMIRVKLGGTAKSVSYSAAAATYGVCAADEIALVLGSSASIPNRERLGLIPRAIQRVAESVARLPKAAAPGAGNLALYALSMTTVGPQANSKYTRSVVAGAAAPTETNIGLLVGNTAYASLSRSGWFLRAVDAALTGWKMNISRKA